jgi:hypothetical protein
MHDENLQLRVIHMFSDFGRYIIFLFDICVYSLAIEGRRSDSFSAIYTQLSNLARRGSPYYLESSGSISTITLDMIKRPRRYLTIPKVFRVIVLRACFYGVTAAVTCSHIVLSAASPSSCLWTCEAIIKDVECSLGMLCGLLQADCVDIDWSGFDCDLSGTLAKSKRPAVTGTSRSSLTHFPLL